MRTAWRCCCSAAPARDPGPAGADLLSIPVWELGRPQGVAQPASPAGLPFDSRPRVKQRVVAKRSLEQLLERAREGFAALTGLRPPGPFLPLGGVKMRLHRVVYVWACDTTEAAPVLLAAERGSPVAAVSSPEDGMAPSPGHAAYAGAGFLPLDEARVAIDPQQRRFLDQLEGLLPGLRPDL